MGLIKEIFYIGQRLRCWWLSLLSLNWAWGWQCCGFTGLKEIGLNRQRYLFLSKLFYVQCDYLECKEKQTLSLNWNWFIYLNKRRYPLLIELWLASNPTISPQTGETMDIRHLFALQQFSLKPLSFFQKVHSIVIKMKYLIKRASA